MSSEDSETDDDYQPSDREDDVSEEIESADEDVQNEKHSINNGTVSEEQTKDADLLWEEFLNDTGSVKAPAPSSVPVAAPQEPKEAPPAKKPVLEESIPGRPAETCTQDVASTSLPSTVSEIFEFAGEKVTVSSELAAKSSVANEIRNKLMGRAQQKSEETKPKGGLGSVLNMISKKTKISTLDKSRLDWEDYKDKTGLTEELTTYNKGKGGYLDKQEFLERSDFRQFEQERDLRLSRKRKSTFD